MIKNKCINCKKEYTDFSDGAIGKEREKYKDWCLSCFIQYTKSPREIKEWLEDLGELKRSLEKIESEKGK